MDPATTALRFTRLYEARDLEAAKSLLAQAPRFVFPGGTTFDDLDACAADRSTRYRSIRKEIEGTHTADAGQGRTAVYVFGTLHGVDLDGMPISGVRFVDRVTLDGGRVVRLDVWNDLAL